MPKPYYTQKALGEKWQLDVKYVPRQYYTGSHPDKFYQYTMIYEASGEIFIYLFKEHSSYSTIQFVEMSISFFGYKTKNIQIDNSFEFIHFKNTKRIHTFDVLCNQLDIKHQLI